MIPLIAADPHGDFKSHMKSCAICHVGGFGDPKQTEFCLEGQRLLDASVARSHWEHDRKYAARAWDLIAARWTFELSESDDVMAWYWRRPPRRKGRPGRLYRSTDQAWNAMKKEAE